MDRVIWKDVDGYKGFYQVSNIGDVRSVDRYVNHWQGGKCIKKGKDLKPSLNHKGYCMVNLQINGKGGLKSIHRLVAEAFIPNPENKPQVNHINGIKSDNKVENLEWSTQSENQRHAFITGLNKGSMFGRKGELHPRNLLSKDDVRKCKDAFSKGHKIKDIARDNGVSYKTIQRALKSTIHENK